MEGQENEGTPGGIKGVVGGTIKKQLGGIVSTTGMIKRIVFGSAYRFLLFVTWLATLLGAVVMHANYEAWHVQNEVLTAFFYISLDGLRAFFFLLSLFWQLAAKRLHKGIIFLLSSALAAMLEIVPILLLKYVSEAALDAFNVVLVLFFTAIDASAVMAEKWRAIESTAPLASMVARKLKLPARHYHPMRWIAFEMTAYLAIKELLHFYVLPPSIRLNASFLFWYFGDYALNLLIVVSYFILRARNDPYHNHLKSIVACAVPLMQGWGILQMFSAYFSNATGGTSLPFLAELLLLAALSIWHVGSNAAQKEEQERDSDKLYAFVLWTYAITSISAFYDAWGLNDILGEFAFMALGVGVVFFVKASADTLAPRYSITNFNFGKFGANKLAYASGEPVAVKKLVKVQGESTPGQIPSVTTQPRPPAIQQQQEVPFAASNGFCNQCGKPVPPGTWRFCKYCGANFDKTALPTTPAPAPVSVPIPVPVPATLAFCTGCGHQVDKPGATFCRYCGKKFHT